MSFADNSYFQVVEPFLVFKNRGTCTTNSWMGASQALQMVKEAILVEKGDEIHALVGGCFLVRPGPVGSPDEISEFVMKRARPLFEKSYGGFVSDQEIIVGLAKNGLLVEIDQPAKKHDYRANPANEKFRHLHPEVIWTQHSPLFEGVKQSVPSTMEALRGQQATNLTIGDIGESREVFLQLRNDAGLLMKITFPEDKGRVMLTVSASFESESGFLSSLVVALEGCLIEHDESSATFSSGFYANMCVVDECLAESVERLLVPAEAARP